MRNVTYPGAHQALLECERDPLANLKALKNIHTYRWPVSHESYKCYILSVYRIDEDIRL